MCAGLPWLCAPLSQSTRVSPCQTRRGAVCAAVAASAVGVALATTALRAAVAATAVGVAVATAAVHTAAVGAA